MSVSMNININGRWFDAKPGETVLDVARREGIDIPALCSLEGTAAWGGCRLCLVEVEGVDKLQAACTTWVADGMSVQTETPRVRARRESYLRMYLSDHNSYCEAPCTHACPTHVDIPGYLAALAEGDAAGAAAIVRDDLPFPGILGRVCPRYCEPVCRRGDVDETIAICDLHRAAADHSQARLTKGAASGKRVAVVGAGPAGLAAAWFLTARGHQVTVYDAAAQPGGSLRYLIPEFRLPASVLDAELQPLWDAGVRFVGDSKMHFESDPQGLFEAGFEAVVLGTGAKAKAGAKQAIPVVTGGAPGLRSLDAADFLRQQREGRGQRLSGSVIVAGDSITAVDAARTALRCSAGAVTVVSRYSSDTMPAGSREIAAAKEEGVLFEFEAPADRLAGKKLDPAVTTVIFAPESGEGAEPVALRVGGEDLWPNRFSGRTPWAGLFVAGDASGGTRSAIHAVAGGKRAALAVDAWLRGEDLPTLEKMLADYARLPYLEQLKQAEGLAPAAKRLAERGPVWLKMGAGAEPDGRAAMPKTPKAKRLAGLDMEVEKGYSLAAAQAEAKRCLQCECPSLGNCDLQRLGVEYGITANDLVKKGSRVRTVQPQVEHPFIRRDMERCIACGRCVRVCRDVAGPACYDFTGRGFTINVNTPYGEALQLADCISCGRCVSTCPTGALVFNERQLSSFKVDESRCILCRECINVCPVDALEETDHFEKARREWLELVAKGSGLAGGHRMCAGCGAPVVVRQVLMGTSDPVVISSATGCLEVSTTIYPYTSWKSSFIHTAFENSAATLSGVETAYRALKKKGAIAENVKFIAFGGDGGTYDIGLQSLSGAMERGHKMLYVCYDNGAYMNTGFQRSGATPTGAWTTTSPVGAESPGKLQQRKNLTDIMIAHGIPYVAQASPHDPRDLVRKAAKALSIDGPTFLNVLAPCPRGWRSDGAESIDLAREAVNTCYWPLFECENGEYHLTYRPHYKLPLVPWLKRQGRFAHLFQGKNEATLEMLEHWVDEEWNRLLRKCGEPSEADWQAHLQANGCLLR
jgi:pyruvate/2-oxoacid:ferredoxin oxidoreductase beta subunit/NADPH-dependent glutamate synthase beta subunit-like oxidoreductase/NAD-dependent dihydropyrimidine dehydrogenase PreA subunit